MFLLWFTFNQVIYFSAMTFRVISFQLMMLVDYAGSIFPVIAHVPWNGLHLAEFVMPFFLFIAGISLAIVYKATLSILFGLHIFKHEISVSWFTSEWPLIFSFYRKFLIDLKLHGRPSLEH